MTRAPFLRPAAALAAVALAIAACGGSTPSATPAPATPAPTGAAPSVALPSLPVSSGLPGFSFDLPSVDEELEALLPDEVAGEALVKSSVSGSTLLMGQGGEDLQAVLDALDKQPEDLTAAIGGSSKTIILAFRIAGIDAKAFYDAFIIAAQADSPGTLTDVTIAGKPAKKFVDSTGTTLYLYLKDDAVITVSPFVPDQAVLDEIFQKLG